MGEATRVWLVERDYDDKGLVRLVYATPDGSRRLVSERSTNMLEGEGVPAATDADPDRLDAVEDPDERDRYASEVERVRDRHGPDDRI